MRLSICPRCEQPTIIGLTDRKVRLSPFTVPRKDARVLRRYGYLVYALKVRPPGTAYDFDQKPYQTRGALVDLTDWCEQWGPDGEGWHVLIPHQCGERLRD